MTPFTLGQRVEWKHSSGARIFRGFLRGWSPDKFYRRGLAVFEDEEFELFITVISLTLVLWWVCVSVTLT